MSVLVFNRWSTDGIVIMDPGLKGYINIEPRVVPRTGGKSAKFRFHKSNVFIIERLINRIMNAGHRAKKHKITSGHMTGKGHTAYSIMEKALEIIEKRTNQNPVAVVVKAIENAAPREEIVTIEYGGAKYPKAVEVAPQRRVDQAIKYMTQISYQKAFNSKRSIINCLAEEIIAAFQQSANSGAIAKKLELERQADSSR
ncbi:30S ribosomal protein S7 [Candidatus Woesearchaeota archaeon]|jgi:small subunit ribosomal protein S7|nr:30S ribosomal protein S7 [Candidatus Woesearchaeota archaeon]